MKKLFASIMVATLIMSLTSCVSSAPSAPVSSAAISSAPTEPKEEKKTELVWCGWSGEEATTKPIIEGMISSWNSATPNAPVSWVGWPWADTLQQLIIRNGGSEKIDVAQIDSSMFPTLIDAGALTDLNTVFDPAWLKENFPAPALEFGQKDGKQYAIPWTTASIGMLYNPTLLASVGYAEPPKTMEEFEDCLKKLREKDKDLIPYAISTKDGTATADFMPWLWAFGGNVFDASGKPTVDSEFGIKVLTWYKSMADKGYIKSNMSRFDARQLFAQGKVAFYDDAIMAEGICESNGVAAADLEKTIQPMLRPVLKEGDKPTSSMWGHMLVIFDKSQDKEEAAEFIKHIVSEEQSLNYFDQSGMLPVMNSAISNEKVTSDPWSGKWSEITATGRDSELKGYSQNAELSTIMSEEIQAVIVGQKTPEAAAKAMQTRLEAAL